MMVFPSDKRQMTNRGKRSLLTLVVDLYLELHGYGNSKTMKIPLLVYACKRLKEKKYSNNFGSAIKSYKDFWVLNLLFITRSLIQNCPSFSMKF